MNLVGRIAGSILAECIWFKSHPMMAHRYSAHFAAMGESQEPADLPFPSYLRINPVRLGRDRIALRPGQPPWPEKPNGQRPNHVLAAASWHERI